MLVVSFPGRPGGRPNIDRLNHKAEQLSMALFPNWEIGNNFCKNWSFWLCSNKLLPV